MRGVGRVAPRLPNDDGEVTGLPPLRRDFRRSSGAVEHGKAPTGCTETKNLMEQETLDAEVHSSLPKMSILLAGANHWYLLSAGRITTTSFLYHEEIFKYHTSIYTDGICLQIFPLNPNFQFCSVLTNSMNLSS